MCLYIELLWFSAVSFCIIYMLDPSESVPEAEPGQHTSVHLGVVATFFFNDIITHLPKAAAPPARAELLEGVESSGYQNSIASQQQKWFVMSNKASINTGECEFSNLRCYHNLSFIAAV